MSGATATSTDSTSLKSGMLLLLASIGGFFLLIEISLQAMALFEPGRETSIYQPAALEGLFYELKPNLSQRAQDGGMLYTSDDGRRVDRNAFEPDPEKRKIAMLGDSVVLGLSHDWSETISGLLERQIADAEFLNFGVNGYGIEQQPIVLREKALIYKPSTVVLFYVLNDPIISNKPKAWFLPQAEDDCRLSVLDLPMPCWLMRCLKFFRTPTFLYTTFVRADARFNEEGAEDYWSKWHREPEIYRSVPKAFAELAKIANENNIRLLLVITPLLRYSEKRYHWAWVHQQLTRDAAAAGIEVLDLLPLFQRVPAKSLRVRENDLVHPNAAGNRIISDAVAAALSR